MIHLRHLHFLDVSVHLFLEIFLKTRPLRLERTYSHPTRKIGNYPNRLDERNDHERGLLTRNNKNDLLFRLYDHRYTRIKHHNATLDRSCSLTRRLGKGSCGVNPRYDVLQLSETFSADRVGMTILEQARQWSAACRSRDCLPLYFDSCCFILCLLTIKTLSFSSESLTAGSFGCFGSRLVSNCGPGTRALGRPPMARVMAWIRRLGTRGNGGKYDNTNISQQQQQSASNIIILLFTTSVSIHGATCTTIE